MGVLQILFPAIAFAALLYNRSKYETVDHPATALILLSSRALMIAIPPPREWPTIPIFESSIDRQSICRVEIASRIVVTSSNSRLNVLTENFSRSENFRNFFPIPLCEKLKTIETKPDSAKYRPIAGNGPQSLNALKPWQTIITGSFLPAESDLSSFHLMSPYNSAPDGVEIWNTRSMISSIKTSKKIANEG